MSADSTVSANAARPSEDVLLEQRVYRIGYASRKALPIKRNDAEALSREDVQHDLLHEIFDDKQAVFTPHTPGTSTKISFSELYVAAIFNSSKCSKVLKEKMLETPEFAIELAKISLLTNVGRINTTMAFFVEMRTALRTYHPIPSLQRCGGNAQDAPRIKNCLKAALLPSEFKSVPPATPNEILVKSRAGHRPPTSVVNLVFVLANHAAPLSPVHFNETINFLDLFLPKNLSSADRARSFLWHMYHYLERPDTANPFADDYARQNPGKSPLIRQLSADERASENVDTKEELEWGKKMSVERNAFLQKLVSSMETEKKSKAPHFVSAAPEAATQSAIGRSRVTRRGAEPARDEPFMYYVPRREGPTTPPRPTVPLRGRQHHQAPPLPVPRKGAEHRTLVQHAWHIMLTSDPLLDSDEENSDELIRSDYSRRLNVISRIRGRPPTPEPQLSSLDRR